MLLDPLEEKLHLPARPVQVGDGVWRKNEVVGQKHKGPFPFPVDILDAPQLVGVFLRRPNTVGPDNLVADDAGGPVDPVRVQAAEPCVGLGPQDEMGAVEVKSVQAAEVEICPVHDMESPGLRSDDVQNVDVMDLAVGDMDECGDVAPEVKQRMQPDGTFGPAETGPGEKGQAQVDGRRIQRVDGALKVGTVTVVGKVPGLVDQVLGEVGMDPPIPGGIGVGKGVPRHTAPDTHVIELG